MLLVGDLPSDDIVALLARYGIAFEVQDDNCEINGSFWGEPEAGIVGKTVYVRSDTPVHSLLHEICHIICMTPDRRACLNRDAGGDDLEESAVCFLQIVLADQIENVGQQQLMRDMDEWGYSFRLGSTLAWFQNDADDAVDFLKNHGLLSSHGEPTFRLRQ